MKNDLWNIFKNTGSVYDYLNYKNNESSNSYDNNNDDEFSRIEITNANYNQGLDNKRTNDR